MHDVLDPRDLVPDEAEQLAHSGFDVGNLTQRARAAAASGDLAELAQVSELLGRSVPRPTWSYVEPYDQATLEALGTDRHYPVPARQELAERIKGAWLGRTIGNTMGKPVEGLSRYEVERYLRAAGQWPLRGYVRLLDPLPDGVSGLHPDAPVSSLGTFIDVPRDDDIDWAILALHMLESYGPAITTEQIAAEWLDRIPFTQTYTAERAAYRNLIRGHRPTETAVVENPYREWVGALIRADVLGYVNPGDPREAARLALVDARLSHVANGIYGEVWAAALLSIALTVDSVEEALDGAIDYIPHTSRLAEALRALRGLHRDGATAAEALDWIDSTLGHYNWVHTVVSAAIIAFGLLWGRDFTEAVALTVSAGRDTDSNGATVGSVYGALHGVMGVPLELVGETHNQVRSSIRDFDRITIDELTARTLALVPAAARVPLEEPV